MCLVFGQSSGHSGTLDLIQVHSPWQIGEGLLLGLGTGHDQLVWQNASLEAMTVHFRQEEEVAVVGGKETRNVFEGR